MRPVKRHGPGAGAPAGWWFFWNREDRRRLNMSRRGVAGPPAIYAAGRRPAMADGPRAG